MVPCFFTFVVGGETGFKMCFLAYDFIDAAVQFNEWANGSFKKFPWDGCKIVCTCETLGGSVRLLEADRTSQKRGRTHAITIFDENRD